jgi:hypothetical protein
MAKNRNFRIGMIIISRHGLDLRGGVTWYLIRPNGILNFKKLWFTVTISSRPRLLNAPRYPIRTIPDYPLTIADISQGAAMR